MTANGILIWFVFKIAKYIVCHPSVYGRFKQKKKKRGKRTRQKRYLISQTRVTSKQQYLLRLTVHSLTKIGYNPTAPRLVSALLSLMAKFSAWRRFFKTRKYFPCFNNKEWDTRWHILLRHCTAKRKFAGSITDGVVGIFHWLNPLAFPMALGSIQPVTEMSTRGISWEVKATGA